MLVMFVERRRGTNLVQGLRILGLGFLLMGEELSLSSYIELLIRSIE